MNAIQFGQCVTLGDQVTKSKKFQKLRQAMRACWNQEALDKKCPPSNRLPGKETTAAALQAAVNWCIAKPRLMTKRKAAHFIDQAAGLPWFAFCLFQAGYIQDRETHFAISLEDFVLVPGEPNEFAQEGGQQ